MEARILKLPLRSHRNIVRRSPNRTGGLDVAVDFGENHAMNESIEHWYSGDLDERISALFGNDPFTAVAELTIAAQREVELESQLTEVLQASLDNPIDASLGTAAATLILGEIASHEAIGPLIAALASDDEMVVLAATRALRRIGEPALEPLLDMLDSPDLDEDVAQSVTESLEGVAMHDLPELRGQIESRLMRELLEPGVRPRRREAAALALARLVVERARAAIDPLLETEFRSGNTYLQEALEILDEHPEGLPCPANIAWHEDLRWADGSVLPGGELEDPDDEESDGNLSRGAGRN